MRKFFDATGGNPFRHLNEERRLFDSERRWRRDFDIDEIDVPSGVRMVVGRRLQRVSRKTQDVLAAAAVIGPYFELDLVAGPVADGARIARALMAAGHAAHAVYATDEAVRHYRHALEILKEGGPEADRLTAAERLADLLTLMGDRSGAMEHYQELGPCAWPSPSIPI